MTESLESATAYLESLINVEKRPDWPYRRFSLDPVRALLERLGGPQQGLPVLHVAGSKGKGSTALLAEVLLRGRGLSTGVFLSPHLERWSERFRLDGEEVDGARLADAVARARPHVEALRAENPASAPTFFDVTTAVALLLFREARVDRTVLEVGLGGRLDSTNACEPHVSCITSIELEHTDRLGTTLEAIAGEKAGILKPGVPAVMGALPEPARRVVEARAAEVGAPLAALGRDFHYEAVERGLEGSRVRFVEDGFTASFDLPLPGPAAPINAALAIACVRRLLSSHPPPPADWVEVCLRQARLPGRIEVLGREPWIVVDAAHTAASVGALVRVLGALRAPVDLVLSISADKDAEALLRALLPLARRVTLTRAEPARSLPPERIARVAASLAPGVELRTVPNPHLALRAAREAATPDAVLCATGSVYLAGIARGVLRDPEAGQRVAVSRPRSPREAD
jgi:dihydrofolate synthase/folylpolyglutamate synthase